MRDDKIELALDECYEAIVTPSSWASALQSLASAFESAALMFYPFQPKLRNSDPRDPDRALAHVPTSHGYKELIDEYERGGWYLNHYRAERGIPLLNGGSPIVIEHQLATDEERRKSRHYNELYLRYGFSGYAMMNVPLVDQAWCIPMVRTPQQGHFSRDDARNLTRLIPHLRRLISLSDKLEIERGRVATSGLSAVSVPAILIDWHGGVRSVNKAAETLLGFDLRVVRGTLSATDAGSDRALKSLIRNALTVDRSTIKHMRASSLIQRQHLRPILVESLPLSGLFREVFGHAHVLLLLTDLSDRAIPRERHLSSIFGLTPAEAKLAAKLASGDDLRLVCDELGIVYETGRSQLRAVFEKTNTHRQGELIALLSRLPR